MHKLLTLAATTLILATGQSVASTPRSRGDTPQDPWLIQLTQEVITREFASRGYVVHNIEAARDFYQVRAVAPDGRRIEAYVHALTGEVLHEKEDN
jgi:hypothetical protein